jgi:hypothetical protein
MTMYPKISAFQDEMDEDEETQQTSVENYTGVAIKVGGLFGPLILCGVDEYPPGRSRLIPKLMKAYGSSNSLEDKSPSLRLPQVRVYPTRFYFKVRTEHPTSVRDPEM